MIKRVLPGLGGLFGMRVERDSAPQVEDDDGARCLRFGQGVLQSSMRLSEPFALDLSYTRAMMGFLLFQPAPQHIVVVGLGGGSLSKFCFRELPDARITTVEIDPAVIALRETFLIPPDNDRFRIVHGDGAEFLARDGVDADVILLDGYDRAGLPADLCSESFYARCRNALKPSGVLVANLWGGAPHRELYVDRLRGVFHDQVWWAKPRDSSSLVVYAITDEHYHPQWLQLMEKARALDARYRLDLAAVVNDLRARPNPEV